ncbi:MAG: EF-P 5-aminopentanol modification-associated protein YfmF [Hominenteromicrobium sp.]
MMNPILNREDCGLQSFWHSTPQFKTARLSVHLVLPLAAAETAAVRAIVPNVISRATREYPDYTEFGRRLAELYGASVQAGVSRIGDNQILTLAASGIANRYAFGGEDIQNELAEILESILFTPLLDEDGLFPEEGFRQEKRQLIETIDSEFNEKSIYAKNRCVEIMFAGEPAGVPRFGTRQALLDAPRAGVKAAWADAVQHAQICQFSIGDGADSRFAERLLGRLGTRSAVSVKTAFHPAPEAVKRVTEEMPLAQSKLVMGLHVGTSPEERLITKLMAVILGGTPSSKLFMNVREKQSLCYYCSAQHDTPKNVIFVQSGVEAANLDRTEEAVLKELAAMQAGDITEDEIRHAKLAMCNSYRSVADSAASIESWVLGGMLRNDVRTPEICAEAIMQVTKDEIVEAARRVTLDTVFKLKGEDAAE